MSVQGVRSTGKGKFYLTTWLGSTGWGDLAVGTGAHVGPGAETISAWTPADCLKKKEREENEAQSNNIKTCPVRWKIKQPDADSCQDFSCAWEKKSMLCVCCLSGLSAAGFDFQVEFGSSSPHDLNFTQNFTEEYFKTQTRRSPGQALPSASIIVKLNQPTWQRLQAILLFSFAINLYQCVFWVGAGCFRSSYSLSHRRLLAWSPAPSSHQVESSHWPLLPEPHC